MRVRNMSSGLFALPLSVHQHGKSNSLLQQNPIFTKNAVYSPVYLLLYLKLSPLVPCVLGIDCCCSHPFFGLRANAVFIRLPAVKHVAKVNPGGVTGRHKRGATVRKIRRRRGCCPADISYLASILPPLLLLLAMSGL